MLQQSERVNNEEKERVRERRERGNERAIIKEDNNKYQMHQHRIDNKGK